MPAAAALRAGLGLPVVLLPTAPPPPPRRAEPGGGGSGGGGWAEERRTGDYVGAIRLFACLLHALPEAAADGDAGRGRDGGARA